MITFTRRGSAPPEIRAVAAALITMLAVLLGAGCGTSPGTATPGGSPSATKATMTVRVYFHMGRGNDYRLAAVARTVPRTPDVATAAMTQLLAGPTAGERHAGFSSFFSEKTATMLRSVRVAHGVAYADFHDFSKIIPNASSSAGSAALLAEMNATLKQFPGVQSTVYSFEGDVAAFYEWMQMVPPMGPTPGAAGATRGFPQPAPQA